MQPSDQFRCYSWNRFQRKPRRATAKCCRSLHLIASELLRDFDPGGGHELKSILIKNATNHEFHASGVPPRGSPQHHFLELGSILLRFVTVFGPVSLWLSSRPMIVGGGSLRLKPSHHDRV